MGLLSPQIGQLLPHLGHMPPKLPETLETGLLSSGKSAESAARRLSILS